MEEARLRRLMEETHVEAFGWARYCCGGDREVASDVLHNVYVKILEKKARFEGRSSFKTWLFAVIRRTAAKHRFSVARSLSRLYEVWRRDESDRRVETEIYRSELKKRIDSMLGRLSKRQHQVLRLVFYHDLTIEEAAEAMGVSLGSARTHYHRGKCRLLEELEESGFRDEYRQGRYGDQAAV